MPFLNDNDAKLTTQMLANAGINTRLDGPDEPSIGAAPNAATCQCTTCMFRAPDVGPIKGALKDVCQMYSAKDYGVLWAGNKCPLYQRG